MIITRVALSDMTHNHRSYPKAALLLASHMVNNVPKLVSIDWLSENQEWQEYTNGKRQYFDLPLDVSIGTPFQQKVWASLQKIPYGKTISYAKLADNIDQPTAFRAVANANGKNPFSIIIPCHRVISSDGKLGGYTGGVDKKAYLLAIEGVQCKI